MDLRERRWDVKPLEVHPARDMRVVQKVVNSDLIRTYHSCLLDMFSRKFAQVSRKIFFAQDYQQMHLAWIPRGGLLVC